MLTINRSTTLKNKRSDGEKSNEEVDEITEQKQRRETGQYKMIQKGCEHGGVGEYTTKKRKHRNKIINKKKKN